MPASIGSVLPREQVGGPTDARYEYQYQQAALECLKLLAPGAARCVYCEWHDDYVVERGDATPGYEFYQVKTRKLHRGPWKMQELLGIPGPRVARTRPTVEEDSVAHRLFEHFKRFRDACALFALITNNAVGQCEFQALVETSKTKLLSELSQKEQKCFARTFASYKAKYPGLAEDELWAFLRRLTIVQSQGDEEHPQVILLLMGKAILDFSEVDLTMSEATTIGSQLVTLVRQKSHRVVESLPASEDDLRRDKAIVVDEILRVLSLSPEGFHLLRQGERDAARTLSRLQRVCRRSGVPAEFVPEICSFKASWDAWLVRDRDIIDEAALLALKGECRALLEQHVLNRNPLSSVRDAAVQICARYAGTLGTSTPLSPKLVIGLVFALAAEMGASHG